MIRANMIRARHTKGFTQEELAALVGVKQSTISKLEAGDHVPLGHTLANLCDQLGLSPRELLALEEEPAPQATGTDGQ